MPETADYLLGQRDAWGAISGFVYQVLVTIDRWLDLDESTTLLCEYGEDICQDARVQGGEPSAEILLEQVKHRTGRTITLRSPDVVEALVNFSEHLESQKKNGVRFRFSSNAAAGTEQAAPFPAGLPGIHAWRAVSGGEGGSKDRKQILRSIKQILGPIKCPTSLRSRRDAYRRFRARVSDLAALEEFVMRVEWCIELAERPTLVNELISKLVDTKLARNRPEARQALQALFFHVFQTLSRPGLKPLLKKDLEPVVSESTLVYADRGKVDRLLRLVEDVPQILPTLDIINAQTAEMRQNLDSGLGRILGLLGTASTRAIGVAASPDVPPSIPPFQAPRSELADEIRKKMDRSTWVSLVGETGSGKTVLARMLIDPNDPSSRWCSLGGKAEDEMAVHVERQVVRWLSDVAGPEMWAAYAVGTINLGQAATILLERLGRLCTLVVDDLPSMNFPDALRRNLCLIAEIFSRSGSKLLTTGYSIPALVLSDLGDRLSRVPVADLTVDDIEHMLESAGAPRAMREASIVALIAGVTSGHPTLAAITVDWLRRRDWKFGRNELDALFSGLPVQQIKKEAWLAAGTALDPESKELLLRLSLVSKEFDDALVQAVAAVDPPLEYPGEAQARLAGPFLIELPGQQYTVTALLRGAGREVLQAQRQVGIHRAVADRFLSQGVIDVDDSAEIETHLRGAGDYRGYALFLIQLMLTAKTPNQAKAISWAGALLDPAPEMGAANEIALRIMIAAGQYRIHVLMGQDGSVKLSLMEELISEARLEDELDQLAVVHALLNTSLLLEQAEPLLAMKNTIRAVKLIREGKAIPGDVFAIPVETAVCLTVFRLRGQDDLRAFLQELHQMSHAERRSVFELDIAAECLQTAIDSCWSTELEQDAEVRNWKGVLEAIDEVREAGRLVGAEILTFLATRTRAVVLADQLGKADEAIAHLDSVGLSGRPDIDFLLTYTKGAIIGDHIDAEAAIEQFESTLKQPTDAFTYFRLDAMRRLGVGLARKRDFDAAAHRYRQAIQFCRQETLLSFDRAELLAELAWVYKAMGDHRRSAGCLYAAARTLEKQSEQEGGDRYRETFWKLIYGFPWFWYTTAHPSSVFPNWTGSVGLVPGMFVQRGYKRDPSISPPFGYSIASLFLMCALASARDVPRLARRAFEVAERLATSDDIRLMCLAGHSSTEARAGDPALALRLGIEAVGTLYPGGVNAFDNLTPEEKAPYERSVLFHLVLGPASAEVLGKKKSPTVFHEWRRLIESGDLPLVESEYWVSALDFLDSLCACIETGQAPPDIPQQISDSQIPEIFYRLGRSRYSGTPLKNAVADQASVAEHLYEKELGHMVPGIGAFMLSFWDEVGRNRAFAVRQPALFREELVRISKLPEARIPAAVATAAAQAIGVSFPATAASVFKFWLRTPL